jgi:hypothetical protein
VLQNVLVSPSGKPVSLNNLPPFVGLVIQAGTALAQQLAFCDVNKRALLDAGAVPVLVAALRSKSLDVHEQCTSATSPFAASETLPAASCWGACQMQLPDAPAPDAPARSASRATAAAAVPTAIRLLQCRCSVASGARA